jgi:hypothetical protein
MKHSIRYFVLLLIIFAYSVSFYSCTKENPTTSNGPLIVDSNIFFWHVDTLHMIPTGDFYIADTNNIFVPGEPYALYKKDGIISYIDYKDNSFGCTCVSGSNINNVYFGGIDKSTSKSKLKKWNGNTIMDIPIPFDTMTYIGNIFAISDNDVWMITIRTRINSYILHYVNGSFDIKRLDSDLSGGVFFTDNNGSLFLLAGKPMPDNNYGIYILKLENNNWKVVCNDYINNSSEMGDYIGFSGDKILRGGSSGIYYFTGNNWDKFIGTGNNIAPRFNAAGDSPQNIMFIGLFNEVQTLIFYYDGNIIYKLPYPANIYANYSYMKYQSGIFYLTTFEGGSPNYLVTAKLKK